MGYHTFTGRIIYESNAAFENEIRLGPLPGRAPEVSAVPEFCHAKRDSRRDDSGIQGHGAGRQNLLFQSENQQGGSGALSGAEGAGPAEPVTYERRRQSLRRFSLLCNQTLHDSAFRPVSITSRCAPELLFLKHLHLPAWCRSVRSETDTSDM